VGQETGNPDAGFNAGFHHRRLALYQQLLAAGAADIDVFQIDVVWRILANHFIDLSKAAAKQSTSISASRQHVGGKLVAFPGSRTPVFSTTAGLLEKYGAKRTRGRADATAQKVQDGDARRQRQDVGYVWQGRHEAPATRSSGRQLQRRTSSISGQGDITTGAMPREDGAGCEHDHTKAS